MLAGYYGGGTPTNVSWQASRIADRARQFGVADHTRWAHAAQQGKEKIEPQKSTTFVFVEKIARDQREGL